MQIMIDGTDIMRFVEFGGLKWSRTDKAGTNEGSNLNGDMIRDRVATKIQLDVSCMPMTTEDHELLANLILPKYVSVVYDDPMYGRRSGFFYVESTGSEFFLRKSDGTELWKGVAFQLKEK